MDNLEKRWHVTMSDTLYRSLTPELRGLFLSEKAFYDDHDLYKNNSTYKVLLKNKIEANKKLDNWKFDQRNK